MASDVSARGADSRAANKAQGRELRRHRELRDLVKFVSVAAILILGSLLVLHYLARAYPLHTRDRFAQWVEFYEEVKANRASVAEDLDVLILGDSLAAMNIMVPRLQPLRGFSLALRGATLIESRFLYEDFVRHFPAPRCVMIMTSYGGYREHVRDRHLHRYLSHGLLSWDELNRLYDASAKFGVEPAASQSRVGFLWSHRLEPQWLQPVRVDAFRRWVFDPEFIADREAQWFNLFHFRGGTPTSAQRPGGIKSDFFDAYHDYLNREFQIEPILDSALLEIFETARRTGSRVLVVGQPLAASLESEATRAWTESYAQHLQQLIPANFPHVKLHVVPTFWPNEHFSDVTHLHLQGALKWSDELREFAESHCKPIEPNQ
ncbi:MAG TPA: hypothetical protein PLZ57_05895 [Pseudobdellovibrionaceae bacterium]|nr:hypothetical protein [Pseudobdellovibrionaceae bacterium]